jgi:hypothetical protein
MEMATRPRRLQLTGLHKTGQRNECSLHATNAVATGGHHSSLASADQRGVGDTSGDSIVTPLVVRSLQRTTSASG